MELVPNGSRELFSCPLWSMPDLYIKKIFEKKKGLCKEPLIARSLVGIHI